MDFGNYTEFVEHFDVPLRPAIKTTFDEIDCWIVRDFMEPHRTNLHLEHGVAKEDVESFYYLRRNPTLCKAIRDPIYLLFQHVSEICSHISSAPAWRMSSGS